MNKYEKMGAVLMFEANGHKVFAVEDLLVEVVEKIPRSLKERLFGFPWRPWVGYYEVKIVQEDPGVYLVEEDGERKIYAHPSKVRQIAIDLIIKLNNRQTIDSDN